jgi:hypothetical protein
MTSKLIEQYDTMNGMTSRLLLLSEAASASARQMRRGAHSFAGSR